MESLKESLGLGGLDDAMFVWIICISVLLVIYVFNTIWFKKLIKHQRALRDETTRNIKEFGEQILAFERMDFTDNPDNATEYFLSIFGSGEWSKFSERNPRYIFNLMNVRNYLFNDIELSKNVFTYLEMFAVSWAKDPKEVFNDYCIVCNYYTKLNEINKLNKTKGE